MLLYDYVMYRRALPYFVIKICVSIKVEEAIERDTFILFSVIIDRLVESLNRARD